MPAVDFAKKSLVGRTNNCAHHNMDLISVDILINVILPRLPKHALVALQNASKRYCRLMLSSFPYDSRTHLEILGEILVIYNDGFMNLLRWFLGRGRADLRWSLLVSGVATSIKKLRKVKFHVIFIYI